MPPLAPVVRQGAPQPLQVRDADTPWRVRILRPPDLDVVDQLPAADADPTDATVPRTFDERGEVIGNGKGSWQFSIFTEDEAGLDIQDKDLIQFVHMGRVIDCGPIRNATRMLATIDGASKKVTTYRGESGHGILDHALIYPANGVGSTPIEEDRVLNWTSPDMDISDWDPVNEIELVDDAIGDPPGTGTWPSQPMGEGWITGNGMAYFIGPPSGSIAGAPVGTIYTAVDVTVPVEGLHRIYLLIDNEGTCYIDSVPCIRVNANDGFRRVSSIILNLSAGTHRIAISSTNFTPTSGPNPMGIAFELWKTDQGGFPYNRIIVSNDSWVGVFFPDRPPGMTPGEAMLILLAEAQARGCLTWLVPSFTAEVDSNGVQWPEYGDLACKTGRTTLWKFTEQLIASGYVDSRIALNGRRWDLYASGTLGVTRDTVIYSTDPDPSVGNLASWEQLTVSPRADQILAKSQFGWSWVETFVADGNAIEGVLGLGALQSPSEVQRWTEAQRDVYTQSQVENRITVKPTGIDDTPLVGYRTLDRVTLDGQDQTVAAVSWSRDRNGRVTYTPKLSSRLDDLEERLRRAIESMVAGTFSGDSKLATPLDQIAYQSAGDCCPPPSVEDPG